MPALPYKIPAGLKHMHADPDKCPQKCTKGWKMPAGSHSNRWSKMKKLISYTMFAEIYICMIILFIDSEDICDTNVI